MVVVLLVFNMLGTAAAAASSIFDEHGGLTEEGKAFFFATMRPALVKAVGDEALVAEPFQSAFMATGYLQSQGNRLFYVNPTFGMLVMMKADKGMENIEEIWAFGATELMSLVWANVSWPEDNVILRFGSFRWSVKALLKRLHDNPENLDAHLKGPFFTRDQKTNAFLIAGPIMRAMDKDIAKCLADFDEKAWAAKLAQKAMAAAKTPADWGFFVSDMIPASKNKAYLVMMDQKTRRIYALFLATRAKTCSFSEPNIIFFR